MIKNKSESNKKKLKTKNKKNNQQKNQSPLLSSPFHNPKTLSKIYI